jgi:uncharacterized membrane protein HdeD (DUF308 family)
MAAHPINQQGENRMTSIAALHDDLAGSLAKNWWLLLLRGLLAVAFGILLFTRPSISVAILITFFGAYSLVDGVFSAYSAVSQRRQHEHWVLMLVGGLCGIAIGLITFYSPGITAIVLLFYIAIWSIIIGTSQIIMAVKLRAEIKGEFWLGLAGLVSVLFGLYLIYNPGAGILSVIWVLAAYAVLFGFLMIALSFRVKGLAKAL